jgi:trimeric autotransporter adhesin
MPPSSANRLLTVALWLSMAFLVLTSSAAPEDRYWDNRYHVLGGQWAPDTVRAILVHRGKVYVGGDFTSIGGVAATNIARWDGTNWLAMGTEIIGPIYSLAAHEGIIYAGSTGTGTTNIARWDGADWSPLGTLPSTVLALAVSTNGSELYAGHAVLGAAGGRYIFKYDGANWTPLGGGVLYNDALSTPVGAVLVDGHDVYLGGQFRNVGGTDATNLARWDGANWWPVGGGVEFVHPSVNATLQVAALAMADGKLYVGGNFTRAGGSTVCSNIARWDGTNWFTFDGGVDFVVRALAVDKNDLYVAGSSWWGDTAIAKWDGAHWVQLGSGIRSSENAAVFALGLRGADLFVGGAFTNAGGVAAKNLSIWHIPQTLEFARVGGRLRLSWPTQALDYILQRNDTLPGSWVNVPQVPQIVNDHYTITNNVMGPTRFFRLYHP